LTGDAISRTGKLPLLADYLHTRILVYDTSSVATRGVLILLGQRDINGYCKKAQRIGSNIHVVTMSRISTHSSFEDYLDRQSFGTITNEEYIAQARRLAESLLIPAFVSEMTEELSVNGKLPNITRISLMQTEWDASHINFQVYKKGLISYYVQVSSLDMTLLIITTDPGVMFMKMTGVFVPSTRANVYSAVDTLILATQGIDYVPDIMEYQQVTYLIAWDLNGTSATIRAVGRAPGWIMNDYGMDVTEDIIRIGTTIKNQQWCCAPYPNPTNSNNTANSTIASTSGNFTIPTPKPSNTTNYISILRIPGVDGLSSLLSLPGDMEMIGQLELGNMYEELSSLRFFDNVAYVVTQFDLSPLYVLGLSDPTNPQILGKLNLSSDMFSDNLQPINDNNTLLLSIGQVLDANAYSLGLQVSVLDARNPAQPTMAQHLVIVTVPYSRSHGRYSRPTGGIL
jgi:hypothetical protein